MSMPITVSDKAAGQLADLFKDQGKPGAMLRVWVSGPGCSGFQYGMGIEEEKPEEDDQVFESNGVRVVVDPRSFSYIDGSMVDWIEDSETGGFKLENPNAPPRMACGCGSGGCGENPGEPPGGAERT